MPPMNAPLPMTKPAESTPAPSEHQAAILKAVLETDDNLIIQAAAGSGKTATLRQICEILPTTSRPLAVCFNRAIAQEFKRKLPSHVEAQTLHAVGFGICRKAVDGIDLDEYKVRNLLDDYADEYMHFKNRQASMAWKTAMSKLISITLATRTNPESFHGLDSLCDSYDIELDEESFGHVAEVIERCRAEQTSISFDDMLDHPLHHDYPFPSYGVVLVDEAQDLNAQQLEFVERLAAGGRIIAVGDRNQAIYGFRGADHAAMDRLQQRFSCRELPLSVCYRCGAAIIQEAQDVVGPEAIQAAPDAKDGMVLRQELKQHEETLGKLTNGDLVVCRINRPLVSPCFELIRRGQKAIIRGRDIGKGLTTLVNRHNKKKSVNSLRDLTDSVYKWKVKRVADLLERNRDAQAQAVIDQVETLMAIAENVDSISGLLGAIQEIFSDDCVGVVFSSIHRAKGLEADCVVYLGPELVPHPMAKGPGALQQERNLDYVARTRAKHALIYQPIPKEKK